MATRQLMNYPSVVDASPSSSDIKKFASKSFLDISLSNFAEMDRTLPLICSQNLRHLSNATVLAQQVAMNEQQGQHSELKVARSCLKFRLLWTGMNADLPTLGWTS